MWRFLGKKQRQNLAIITSQGIIDGALIVLEKMTDERVPFLLSSLGYCSRLRYDLLLLLGHIFWNLLTGRLFVDFFRLFCRLCWRIDRFLYRLGGCLISAGCLLTILGFGFLFGWTLFAQILIIVVIYLDFNLFHFFVLHFNLNLVLGQNQVNRPVIFCR